MHVINHLKINRDKDIHQLNLIMEVLGTPPDDFMLKISSESVSNICLFITLLYCIYACMHGSYRKGKIFSLETKPILTNCRTMFCIRNCVIQLCCLPDVSLYLIFFLNLRKQNSTIWYSTLTQNLQNKKLPPNKDIDHLTRILVMCGTPDTELIAKITSDEVR